MAGLAPSEIAVPIRSILRKSTNTTVLLAEVKSIDLTEKQLKLAQGADLAYDFQIGLQFEHFAETLPHDGMVFREQNSDRFHGCHVIGEVDVNSNAGRLWLEQPEAYPSCETDSHEKYQNVGHH